MNIATASPCANFDGRFVVIEIPSGKKTIEIALDAKQGALLARQVQRATQEAFEKQEESNVTYLLRRAHAD